jgi:hypothetical protein
MADATLVEESVEDVIAVGLADADGGLLVVNPARATVRDLVTVLTEASAPTTVRLLTEERPLKDLMDDFLVASAAADLVAAETLAIRTATDMPRNSLLLAADALIALVSAGEAVAGLRTEASSFVDRANDYYGAVWDGAGEFSLRTPPLSRIRETLAAELGDETAADFDAVLESLDVAVGDGKGLDEVTISLLVAARNGELLYDISKWGEDVGLASKATFSRTKTRLEDQGLVDTEKVPIDVGRPRLRLMLGDDRLAEADVADLAAVAQDLLAE